MTITRLVGALLVALTAASCSGVTDPSSNTVTPFTGIVQPNGVSPFVPFTVSGNGEIIITLLTMTPGNAYLGVGYGQVSGNSCGLLQQAAISSANLKQSLTVQAFAKGTYCVIVFDPSATLGIAPLSIGQSFTGQVSHP